MAPAAPTAVRRLAKAGGKVVVEWTAPDSRGSPLIEFEVAVASGGHLAKWRSLTAPAAPTLLSLPASHADAACVRVRAKSALGFGEWSQSAAVLDESVKSSTQEPESALPLRTAHSRRKVVPETPSHTLPPAPSASSVAKACRRRTGPSSWWRPGRVEMLMLLVTILFIYYRGG
ncbi:hypothetical protein T492DRAFT_46885 [Pavlovales sp. CCMP2436]|nr:hypothetical protein T492DRAFT_46885 [Pavlovales sp. CCMP2436]